MTWCCWATSKSNTVASSWEKRWERAKRNSGLLNLTNFAFFMLILGGHKQNILGSVWSLIATIDQLIGSFSVFFPFALETCSGFIFTVAKVTFGQISVRAFFSLLFLLYHIYLLLILYWNEQLKKFPSENYFSLIINGGCGKCINCIHCTHTKGQNGNP